MAWRLSQLQDATQEKTAAFQLLDHLDSPDDGLCLDNKSQALLRLPGGQDGEAMGRGSRGKHAVQSVSAPAIGKRPARRAREAAATPSQLPLTGSVNAVQDDQPPFIGALPRSTRGKRKKPTIQLKPENQRIFAGKVFFFIPPDDIAPVRRMRIEKVIQYGGQWARDWHRCVTHIIADERIQLGDVLKLIGKAKVPSGVALVTHDWISDSLAWGAAADALGWQYRVAGSWEHGKEGLTGEVKRDEQVQKRRKSSLVGNCSFSSQGSEEDDDEQRPRGEELRLHSGDELDAVVHEARLIGNLPLDQEDSPDAEIGSSESQSVRPPSPEPASFSSKKRRQRAVPQCLDPPSSDSSNNGPNADTIQVLQQMAAYYDGMQDNWRTLAYRKAIAALRHAPNYISTADQALALPGIGVRIASKVEEIATTGRLRRLEAAKLDEHDQTLSKFMRIYGVGFHQAKRWVQLGHRSLDDLVRKAHLTDNQRIGIEHYDDFAQRIPRPEVAQLGAVVAHALHGIDAAFQVTIGGSYRRGAQSSGDVDLIITKPDAPAHVVRAVVLERLVPRLFKSGFLRASLATARTAGGSTWHGACALPAADALSLPPVWRRIDFLLVPWREIGAAMIYFTGNDIFNRSMRLLARKKGMTLNQRGLYKHVLRDQRQKTKKKLSEGSLVEGFDERRIFQALGVPWREPVQRQI